MPRKKGGVEIGIAVGLLAAVAGCASGPAASMPADYPVPVRGIGTPPPDGLDYMRAVQCGGLLWARQTVAGAYGGRKPGLLSMVGLYREWAELRAGEAGKDVTLALHDMAASRDVFLSEAGAGSGRQVNAAIEEAYPGDVKSCESAAAAADFDIVIVGG